MSIEISKINQLKRLHCASFKGLIAILKRRKTFLKWYYLVSYFLCISFSLTLLYCPEYSYNSLLQLNEIVLMIFPSLCGFSVSGLAIVIAFGSQDLMKKSVQFDDYNIYQSGIAIFAANIILQLIAIGFSICIKFISSSEFPFFTYENFKIATIINLLAFVFLSIVSVTAFIMTFFVVANLFTFGQVNSFDVTLSEYVKQNSEDNSITSN